MFCCAPPPLLMNQIQVAKSRLPVSIQFKERRLSYQFVGCRNSVIARASNIPGPIFCELGSAELEQADIRARACLGSKSDSILATASIKLKSKLNASAARLISSIDVPTGIFLSVSKTMSAGFLSGGNSVGLTAKPT